MRHPKILSHNTQKIIIWSNMTTVVRLRSSGLKDLQWFEALLSRRVFTILLSYLVHLSHINFLSGSLPWYFLPDENLVSQSCRTLCDPMNYCSLPSSSVHGILQGRILEWIAISFSRGSSQRRDGTQVSCIAGGFFTNWTTS